jgi:hypothetical protein
MDSKRLELEKSEKMLNSEWEAMMIESEKLDKFIK